MNINGTNGFLVMQKNLDALWTRQKVISDNIANMDTPGYKAKRVNFEDVLSSTLNAAVSNQDLKKDLKDLSPEVYEENNTSIKEDGNNVDENAENVDLVRSTMQYETMIRMISSEFSRMRCAVTEGRR